MTLETAYKANDELHLLTAAEVAELMGLTPANVRYLEKVGILHSARRIGQVRVFTLKAVKEAIRFRSAPKEGKGRPYKQIGENKSKKTKKATE